MGWNKQLEIPAGGKGDLRAAVRVSKKGKASLILGLSDRVTAQLNGAKRANIWLGDGDEAGQVLVQFDGDGNIPVSSLKLGGAALRMELPAEVSRSARRATVCTHEFVETAEALQLIVTLPSTWLA